jgi:aminoglycoside 3-N-acetyltransferase
MLSRIKSFLKNKIEQYKKKARRNNPISIDKILSDIEKLGINKGDSIFVHSKLSSVGFINGDVNKINEKFIELVGENGRVFMPTFSSNGYSFDYLSTNPVFDVNNTKSNMGVLTEKFRLIKDVKRSIHPTHSVAVWAKDKEYFTDEHHLDIYPFGIKSPFYKFLQLKNTKAVCLGLTIFPVTLFRVFETVNYENYPVKVFNSKIFNLKAIDEHGNNIELNTLAHETQISNIRRNMLFENKFFNINILQKISVGNSISHVLNTEKFYQILSDEFNNGNMPYMGFYKDFEQDKVDLNRLQIIES